MLRPFRQSDFPIYQSWFSDSETRRWVSFPDNLWLAHVFESGRSECWVLEDAGLPGGVLQVDWDEHWRAFVAIVVDPTKRRRGLGKRLLRSFVDCHSQPFEAITGSVEPDNRASLALALRCGFEQIEVDDEAFVRLQSKKS